MRLMVLIVLSLLCPVVCLGTAPAVAAAEAADAVQPQWIWSSEDRKADGTASFSRSVQVPKDRVRAALWVATDYSRLAVQLNGEHLARLEPYDPPRELDVSAFVQAGENTIRLEADTCPGPSAVAVQLVVHSKDSPTVSIASDSRWMVANDGDEGGPAKAVSFGQVARVPWQIPANHTQVNPFDDYTQWKRALQSEGSAQSVSFQVEEGFQVERVRAAGADEGSWISMAFDPRGRLVISREDRGLLRMQLSDDGREVTDVEVVDDELEECRGLLFAHDSLYANANNSKGLYRLRDTNDDDQFDEVELLYRSSGGVGHGRNDLALGPEGKIYSIHGDAVDLPRDFEDQTSPLREHRQGAKTREGHVIRTDPDGENWELLVAGLRNPYGIAINAHGEMFTYDADAEFDMGSPWYRPTRVNHLVPGGDFGWRGVTGKWPPYFPDHPDNALPNLGIGKGSPTAVRFGYESNFPAPYRQALFVLDWAYGRILAVHMVPRGASYVCRAEPFLRGRPLNVTDLTFGPDGAMYFVTGGRKTQSGLYRVRYVGPPVEASAQTPQQAARSDQSREVRKLRRQLEKLHEPLGPSAVKRAWPHLDHDDPWIRHAARIAVEHQPIESWQERAFCESRPTAALTALMALARSDVARFRPRIVARIASAFPLDELTEPQRQIALYCYSLCDVPSLDASLAEKVAEQIEPLYPTGSRTVDRRMSQLLVDMEVPSAVARTIEQLETAEEQVDQLQGLFVLRNASCGWTGELRRRYFVALNRSAQQYLGGQGMPGFLENIREDAIATLSERERQTLGSLIEGEPPEEEELPPRPFVRKWGLEELVASSKELEGRDYEQGKQMFSAALCSRCHRLGRLGTPVGPELTSVASRFSRRDLLESIVSPSRVIAEDYRSHRIVTKGGKVLEGRVVYAGDYRSPTLKIATDPEAPGQVTEIEKNRIESHQQSPVSFMPEGLLDTLHEDEILDLLAFLEAAGDPDHPYFR